ncbi:hypothetical protein APASM_3346 [Actinosynnema pretiosum subsp. pretiosum]|nr:hypothetical protein APASM_3346 [Actinosynnema pretiosum subsp. pretiosum]
MAPAAGVPDPSGGAVDHPRPDQTTPDPTCPALTGPALTGPALTGPALTAGARTALDLARRFVHAVEAKDLGAVSDVLAPDVRQLFAQSGRASTPDGIAELISRRAKGFRVAHLKGLDEVLAYTGGIFAKFDPLVWRDHRWHAAEGGGAAHFAARGDMVVARTGEPYRNDYVIRFEVVDGRIARMTEHGDALRYAGLGVRPNAAEFRALLRDLAFPRRV